MNGANEMATTLTSANETRIKPTSTPHHWCAECALGFRKLKTLEQHRAGKRHRAVVAERDSVFDKFRRGAPLWAVGAEPADVVTGWSPAELSAVFPMRATCLDKHATVGALAPRARARFWRYLHDRFGTRAPLHPRRAVEPGDEGLRLLL